MDIPDSVTKEPVTIGLDPEDKSSRDCVLNEAEEVLLERLIHAFGRDRRRRERSGKVMNRS
jgi:hypothetical protein